MIAALTVLLCAQLLGEVIARGLALPVPGPVIGLVLTAAGLMVFGIPEALRAVSRGLLGQLGLLFVPAGVGVVQLGPLMADHGVAIGAAIVGSTLVTLLVTVGVFRLCVRWLGLHEDDATSEASAGPQPKPGAEPQP